ncbi:MAG: hypothetical protein OQK24_05295 [Magnetovibrio sp.]|nr:hypothetical protein [Magnetovibrio sp.]
MNDSPTTPPKQSLPKGFSSPEEFLEMRINKVATAKPSKPIIKYGYLHAFWIGAALLLWGMLMGIPILPKIGLLMWFFGFLMHYKSIKKRNIFINKRNP